MISEKEIAELTDEIVSVVDPEKVLLFGSYAAGNANEDSDLDLLVVVRELTDKKFIVLNNIYKQIWGKYNFSKDIKLCTIGEINEWENAKNAFLSTAVNLGKPIYEKQI